MATKTKNDVWVRARETISITVGARPIEYQRRIVRDRRTGMLVEIDIHELPPADPGDEGVGYVFRAGERVSKTHPAVKQSPHAFVSLEEASEMNLGEA
jgi:hypothetical protein